MNGIVAFIVIATLVSFGSTNPSQRFNPLRNAKTKQIEKRQTEETIKIGAFNIKVYGVTKYGKPDVVANILLILARYDMICIQEIKDASNTSFPGLFGQFNAPSSDYNYVLAERVGRSSQKEQYACIYNTSRLEVLSWATYDDTNDVFEREPLVMKIHVLGSNAISDFGMIVIHTKPTDAPNEIDALVDVYDEWAAEYGIQDFIIFGDFNAGSNYVSASEWNDIRLRTQDRFTWLIDDDVDTTVYVTTTHAYDRIVLVGDRMMCSYISNTANVFDYETELGLTYEEAKDVSDHYPVELSLYRSGESPSCDYHPGVSLIVPCVPPLPSESPLDLLNNCTTGNGTCAPGFVAMNIAMDEEPSLVVVKSGSAMTCSGVLDQLYVFMQYHPNMMYNSTVDIVSSYISTGSVLPDLPSIPEVPAGSNYMCELEIKYAITDPFAYDIVITKSGS